MSYSVSPPNNTRKLMQNFINRCLEITARDRAIKAFLKPNETNSKPTNNKD